MVNNKKRIFFYSFLVLFAGIIFTSISYSYSSGNLAINGNSNVNKNSWNVYLNNLNVKNEYKDTNVSINRNSTRVYLDLSLNNSSKYIEFTVDVKNDSLYDLQFGDISYISKLSDDMINNLIVNYYDENDNKLDKGYVLSSGDSLTIKVTVDYKDIYLNNNDTNFNVIIDFSFIQNGNLK